MKSHIAIGVLLAQFFLVSLIKAEYIGDMTGGNTCRLLIDSQDRAAMLSRNFLGGQSNRWPNSIVPYEISSRFSASQKQVILDSMKHISDRTCVQFVEKTSEHTNYVDIYTGERGCFANLGYNSGRIRNKVHLQSNGCVFLGIVVHELLHSLGFGHEQTRFDRDEYIQINWSNIQSGAARNFWRALGEKEDTGSIPYCGNVGIAEYDRCHAGFRASTFGKAYDYGSVMHYGLNFFSNNGEDTMTLKKETSASIPNRSGMSSLDVEKTNAAYNCQAEGTTMQPTNTTAQPEETTSTGIPTTASSCVDTWKRCKRYTRLCGRNSFINRNCKLTCFNCECKNLLEDETCARLGDYCRFLFIRGQCAKKCKAC